MNLPVPYSAEPARGWLPWGALAPFLAVLFVGTTQYGGSKVLEWFHLGNAKGDPIGLAGLFAFLLFPFALTGLAVLAWVRFIERRPLATLGLTGGPAGDMAGGPGGRAFLRGHAIGLATSFALVTAIWLAGGYAAGGVGKAFGSLSALLSMGFLLLCFAVQSSVEELLFRGWLLQSSPASSTAPSRWR